jgi:hypothetical protein
MSFLLSLSLLLLMDPPLYENPAADQMIRQTMEATYNLRLVEARRIAENIKQQFPGHPAGYALAAETYWWEAQADPGNERIEDAYYAAQKATVETAEAALKAGKYPKVEITAYLASSHGSYARFQVTQKEAYFSAMRAGLRAHGYAKDVYAMDRNYLDIHLGLGAFNCFTGSLPAVVKPFAWLIGARGDKQLGLQQLQTAMGKSRYARTEARIVYYTVLLEDKNYPEAFRALEGLMADYPDNYVMYIWGEDWFRRQGKNLEGAQYFEGVYEKQVRRSPLLAKYALLTKAQLELAHNRKADAGRTIERIKQIAGGDRLVSQKIQALDRRLDRRESP